MSKVRIKPVFVYQKKISNIDVGKYYLKSEFARLFPEEGIREVLALRIDELSKEAFWRLLEAMSFTYRINGVFWFLGDERYVWGEERFRCEDLTMTGLSPQIDRTTHSVKISQNPVKFRDFLVAYFKKNKKDKLGLNQFRKNNNKIFYPKIILREEEGRLLLVDGSNRLVAQLLRGEIEVDAYVGRKIKQVGRRRVGDSIFVTLKRLYIDAPKREKTSILETIKRLAESYVDGFDAVKMYWVDNVRRKEDRLIGKKLIEELTASSNKVNSLPGSVD